VDKLVWKGTTIYRIQEKLRMELLTMSTVFPRVDFDDATPTCWKYQITSH